MNDTFDPQQYADELEAAGAPRPQAAIHARTLAKVLKDYVRTVDFNKGIDCIRKEMHDMEERLLLRIEMVRTELKADILALSSRMDAMRADITSLRAEMVVHRWTLGGLFAVTSANLALTFRIAFP